MSSVIIAICFTVGLIIYNHTVAKEKGIANAHRSVRIFVFLFTLSAFLGSLVLPATLLFGIMWVTSQLFPNAIMSPSLLSLLHLSILASFSIFLYDLFIETPLQIVVKKLKIPLGFLAFTAIAAETTILLWLTSFWVTDVTLTVTGTLLVSGFHVACSHLLDGWLTKRSRQS
ncbi:hypothetical protein ACQCN2_01355 [Brevibacillus ginsengisoli]|uniref:hypothetical protein n=1 Tax=Brevibacillus ginsengisoli TaxID=363854 RepID=UPI003CE87062